MRRRRQELRLSQEGLARLVGVAVKTVIRWENGQNAPYPAQRKRLATTLGLKQSDLAGDRDPASQGAA